MVKIFCDKEGCGKVVEQSEGGGTFIVVMKTSKLDPTTNDLVPSIDQEEYHLCAEHAKEIVDYLKNKKVEKK